MLNYTKTIEYSSKSRFVEDFNQQEEICEAPKLSREEKRLLFSRDIKIECEYCKKVFTGTEELVVYKRITHTGICRNCMQYRRMK